MNLQFTFLRQLVSGSDRLRAAAFRGKREGHRATLGNVILPGGDRRVAYLQFIAGKAHNRAGDDIEGRNGHSNGRSLGVFGDIFGGILLLDAGYGENERKKYGG